MAPVMRLKFQLHAFMAGNKAQPTVKTMGGGAGFIGRQLCRSATLLPGQIKGISHQGITNAAAAARRTDAHRFNLSAPGAFVAEARNKGQLQASNDNPSLVAHDQSLARIIGDCSKGIAIGLGQRISQFFSSSAQLIVSQKLNNGRKIRNKGGAKLGILGHANIRQLLWNRDQSWSLYKLKTKICPEMVAYVRVSYA